MKPHFEIKYLDTQWYDQDTVTHVTESFLPLEVEYNNDINAFECETTIYPKAKGVKKGQLAFRFLNKKQAKPYIEKADGTQIALKSLFDKDTGRTWWIEAISWNKETKRWLYQSLRTAGTIKFVLQNTPCLVHLGSMDFTADELERYLQDFKSDLWEVILDERSYVQADVKTNSVGGINEKVIQCFNNLLTHSEKILQSPKVELREIQTLKPRKTVRPINRTFMELATKTNQRLLTSRASQPSYNVPENRYILFVLERCYQILKQLVILSGNKSGRYSQNIKKLKDQHDNLKSFVQIDRDLVVKDIEKLREEAKLEYWTKKLNHKISELNITIGPYSDSHQIWLIELTSKAESGGFFAKVKKPLTDFWTEGSHQNGWIFLDFSDALSDLEKCLEKKFQYELTACINQQKYPKSTRYTITNFSQIRVIGGDVIEAKRNQFRRERDLGIQLNAKNWQKSLNSQELSEQEKEKKALINRMAFYQQSHEIAQYVNDAIKPKQKKLHSIIIKLKELDIKPSSIFPNSMTFVQNPNYQGLHTLYKQLRNITNLADDNLLLSLEEIDKIGLINMPLLYERWCLIQLIKVLTEQFRFTPQYDWKQVLIEMVRSNTTDLKIFLSNKQAKRDIFLTYEKTLDNNKRPDFVLDLKWQKKDHNQTILEDSQYEDTPFEARLVLDAKFYSKETFERFCGLGAVIQNLYEFKNYSENGRNSVFVLHPCQTALPEKITPQAWGKHSYLGELSLFDWEIDKPPVHRFGAIFFSPTHSAIYLDELQRLIGLFLQYNLETTSTASLDSDDVTSQNICLRCGSTDIKLVNKGNNREYTQKSRWYECNECHHFASYNHCKCLTRFIKNGFYWTYHSARAIDPFNNKCPNCGDWGAW